MNKMKKVPEIRFKEFAEDWENTDASIIFNLKSATYRV